MTNDRDTIPPVPWIEIESQLQGVSIVSREGQKLSDLDWERLSLISNISIRKLQQALPTFNHRKYFLFILLKEVGIDALVRTGKSVSLWQEALNDLTQSVRETYFRFLGPPNTR